MGEAVQEVPVDNSELQTKVKKSGNHPPVLILEGCVIALSGSLSVATVETEDEGVRGHHGVIALKVPSGKAGLYCPLDLDDLDSLIPALENIRQQLLENERKSQGTH